MFLSGERERDYALDIQRQSVMPDISDPFTFQDWGPGALSLGASLATGGFGGVPDFGGAGGGGGGGGPFGGAAQAGSDYRNRNWWDY